MSRHIGINRRRFIGILASTSVPIALSSPLAAAPKFRWNGRAMGAEASLSFSDCNEHQAMRAARMCAAELDRLESEFSLFRPGSALNRLNRDGRLDHISMDFRRLLMTAIDFNDITSGYFDPRIQSAWSYIATQMASGSMTDFTTVARALTIARKGEIELTGASVRLSDKAMTITLNGIAQGYMTDRIADLLRNEGFDSVLVSCGEIQAIGGRNDPWKIALDHPRHRQIVQINDRAMATSSGSGSIFETSGRLNHIIDPVTGRSPAPHRAVTVLAPTAVTADALSTAFCLMDDKAISTRINRMTDVTAIVSDETGVRTISRTV